MSSFYFLFIFIAFAFIAAQGTLLRAGEDVHDESLGGILRTVGGDLKKWLSKPEASTTTPTLQPSQLPLPDQMISAQRGSLAADKVKMVADDALQKLQSLWKAASDEWAKASKDVSQSTSTAPLKTKLDSATLALEKGQQMWDAASAKWGDAKEAFKKLKQTWRSTPGDLAEKLSALAKTADSDTLISDAKALADKLKSTVDRLWLAALSRFRNALAANQSDPSNEGKKLDLIAAQKALRNAEAKKKSSDAEWEKRLNEWKQKISDLHMPQTPLACGATLSDKDGIDAHMRAAHQKWLKAFHDYKKAREADSRRSDASTKRTFAKAQREFDSASTQLDRDVAAWDSRTSAFCEKGMYCTSMNSPPSAVVPINPGGPMMPAPVGPVVPILPPNPPEVAADDGSPASP